MHDQDYVQVISTSGSAWAIFHLVAATGTRLQEALVII